MNPLVSIITVSYNHPEVTIDMLHSLQKITYKPIEIFVIDNASPNDDPTPIRDKFPDIHFIRLDKNIGFAGANNVGIKLAQGKYVLLLNNDTEVPSGFLEPLVQKMEANLQIGVVSPKIKFYHFPDTIQYAGVTPFHPLTIRTKGLGYGKVDKGQFDKDSKTAFAHGAAMMVSMSAIKKAGLLPDVYFLYYEELDWCEAIRRAGYEVWYVHNSTVLHKESVSTGRLSPLKTYYMNRARLIFLQRNLKFPLLWFSIIYQLLVAIPKNLTFFLLKGQFDLFGAYWKALWWNLGKKEHYSIKVTPRLEELTHEENNLILEYRRPASM